jgi:hypothetical protein
MKFLVFIALSASMLMSCKKDEKKPTTPTPTPATEEGHADITLTMPAGEVYQLNGPCGWATAGGTNYIGANHASNNLKTFSAFFNISELPSQTTSYTLVGDGSDTDPAHITMNITEINGDTLTEWHSETNSGTLTMVVNGNEITVNLAGITLYPETNPGFFTSGNVGAFANNGALTGTLTFYK